MVDYVGPMFPPPPAQQGVITSTKGNQTVNLTPESLCDAATFASCADGLIGVLLLKRGGIYAAAFLPRDVFTQLYEEFVRGLDG